MPCRADGIAGAEETGLVSTMSKFFNQYPCHSSRSLRRSQEDSPARLSQDNMSEVIV
jgi:hypothetical protein